MDCLFSALPSARPDRGLWNLDAIEKESHASFYKSFASGRRSLALVVVPVAFALRFTDDSYNMPQGFTGQPYSKTFDGAGGCGPALPYQYRVLAGALPPGLSLSKGGTISGSPDARR